MIIAVGVGVGIPIIRGGAKDMTIPQAYDGSWTGTVSQGVGFDNSVVDATMTMRRGQRAATLKYSTVACDSELTLRDDSAGQLMFDVTGGQCSASTVRVYISNGVLVLNASGPATYSANGNLNRTGG